MTLPRIYAVALSTTLCAALLAVLLGGELPGAFWLVIVPIIAALSRRRHDFYVCRELRLSAFSKVVSVALAAVAVIWPVWTLWSRGLEAAVLAGGGALLVLLAARVVSSSTLNHDSQSLLLALMVVFSGSVLNTGVTFAIVVCVFAVAAVWALIGNHIITRIIADYSPGEGGITTAALQRRGMITLKMVVGVSFLGLGILVLTAMLFVAFPRVGYFGFGALGSSRGRLPDEVALDGDGRVKSASGVVVARVAGLDFADFAAGLYLRGPVYFRLTSAGFRGADIPPPGSEDNKIDLAPAVAAQRQVYEIYSRPVMSHKLLTLGPWERAGVISGGSQNPSTNPPRPYRGYFGGLRVKRRLSGPVRYRVIGAINHRDAGHGAEITLAEQRLVSASYLELPAALDPRILDLIGSLSVADESPRQRVARSTSCCGAILSIVLSLRLRLPTIICRHSCLSTAGVIVSILLRRWRLFCGVWVCRQE